MCQILDGPLRDGALLSTPQGHASQNVLFLSFQICIFYVSFKNSPEMEQYVLNGCTFVLSLFVTDVLVFIFSKKYLDFSTSLNNHVLVISNSAFAKSSLKFRGSKSIRWVPSGGQFSKNEFRKFHFQLHTFSYSTFPIPHTMFKLLDQYYFTLSQIRMTTKTLINSTDTSLTSPI